MHDKKIINHIFLMKDKFFSEEKHLGWNSQQYFRITSEQLGRYPTQNEKGLMLKKSVMM